MNRLFAATVLLGITACATQPAPHGGIRLIEESYGVFEVENQTSRLVAETERVPCALGRWFGVRMTVVVADDSGGEIPLGGELRAPPIEGVRPEREEILPRPFMMPNSRTYASFSSGYTFEVPEELVGGRYTLRFYNRETLQVYHERSFEVVDCP